MLEGFDIICIATSNWKQPWGSRQQIMSRLSSSNRVLFIEYQISFLHFLKFPQFLLRLFTPRIRYVANNLIIYRPWLNIPFGYYSKLINLLNQRLLLMQLRRLIKKYNFSKIILWTFEPTSYFLIGKLKELISVYHCIDSFKNEKKSFFRRKCIKELEGELCKKNNIVFASTEYLLAEKIKLNKQAYLLPSAVSESFFDSGYLAKFRLDAVNDIPRPRIGFVGTLDSRIDFELINFIANVRPGWSLILIGSARNRKLANLLSHRNIRIFGFVDYNLVPIYINSFDVGIIPYTVNDFSKGICPIKVFEYLALGKPVVASDLPALRSMNGKNLLKIAKNKEDFVDAINECLTNDNLNMHNSRIEFAKANTWRDRVEAISEILINHLAKKNAY